MLAAFQQDGGGIAREDEVSVESVGMDHRDLGDDAGKGDVVILEVGARNGRQAFARQVFALINIAQG